MNKDMIFDADGQAAQTELKDQRKGADFTIILYKNHNNEIVPKK